MAAAMNSIHIYIFVCFSFEVELGMYSKGIVEFVHLWSCQYTSKNFFTTKYIFGKFVEFNLLKGGVECSACEVNSMIKKRVRTMSFQPRKHSGMQQLYQKDTLVELIVSLFLYHFGDYTTSFWYYNLRVDFIVLQCLIVIGSN